MVGPYCFSFSLSHKALLFMVFRQGIKNGKVSVNPAKEVERRTENNNRDRYLLPMEETALRQTILESWPEHMPEVEIALHTGMRRGEQFKCEWSWVDLDRRVLTVPGASMERNEGCTSTMMRRQHSGCCGASPTATAEYLITCTRAPRRLVLGTGSRLHSRVQV